MTIKRNNALRTVLIGAPAAAAALAVELWGPMWLAGGAIYLAFVLISLSWPRPRLILWAAATASVIVAHHLAVDLDAPNRGEIVAHCLLWSGAILATAWILLTRQRAEARNHHYFSSSPDLLFVVGFDGLVERVNPAAERSLGYSSKEFLKRPYLDFVHPEDRDRAAAEIGDLSGANGPSHFACRLRHRDGSFREIDWTCFAVPNPRHVYCSGRDVTERHRNARALASTKLELHGSQTELQALAARLISIQEDERRRLARELHDSVGQKLAAISVEAQALAKHSGVAMDHLVALLHEIPERLASLTEEIRFISHQTYPAILDNVGLVAALEAECEAFSQREGISMVFKSVNAEERLPDEIALCLYRVAQECLTNIARHSGAGRASMTLTGGGGQILLSVVDDGAGFDPAEANGKGGLGLVSMRERVRLVDGKISVASMPGVGTEVEVEIPLPGEP
jgi:PAS domain S-box-containing protein